MPDFKISPTVNGSTVSQTETSAATTDDTIEDASLWGRVTGGVLVKTAWSNIKSVLTTLFNGLYVGLTGDQPVAGVKTFSSDVVAGVIRRAVETDTLVLIGGTSTTQGPYIALTGKDVGGANDGNIEFVTSTESSAAGDVIWWKYNGTGWTRLMTLLPTGRLGIGDVAPLFPLHVANSAGAEIFKLGGYATYYSQMVFELSALSGGYGSIQFDQQHNAVAGGSLALQKNAGTVSVGTEIGYGKFTVLDAFADTLTFNRSPEIALINTNSTNGNYTAVSNFNSAQAINAGIDFINVDHSNRGAVALVTRASAGVYARRLYVDADGLVGIGTETPAGKLHVDQASTTAAIPVLILDQADLSEEFIEFTGTVGAGNSIDTAAIGTYYGKIRVNVTGVGYKYIPLYNT